MTIVSLEIQLGRVVMAWSLLCPGAGGTAWYHGVSIGVTEEVTVAILLDVFDVEVNEHNGLTHREDLAL